MEKVAKNVFLNEDPEQFVNCWKVPRVSLKPWTGTDTLLFLWWCQIIFSKDCEDETEILLSRPRREIRTKNERIVRVEDLGKSSVTATKNFYTNYISLVEMLHNTIEELKKKISELEEQFLTWGIFPISHCLKEPKKIRNQVKVVKGLFSLQEYKTSWNLRRGNV